MPVKLSEEDGRCIKCRREAGEEIRIITAPTEEELSTPSPTPKQAKLILSERDLRRADTLKKIVTLVCGFPASEDILKPSDEYKKKCRETRARELFKYCLFTICRLKVSAIAVYLGILVASNINAVIKEAERRLGKAQTDKQCEKYMSRFLEVKRRFQHR